MTNRVFTFYEDPGHGWLAVNQAELNEAGLLPADFSSCSYVNKSHMFLEEDCDAPKFIDAFQKATGEHVDLRTVYQDPTPIRDMANNPK